MTKLILLSLVLSLAASVSTFNCENADFVELNNGKCYKLITSYVNYQSAVDACGKFNAQPVEIMSDDENTAIANYLVIKQVTSAWIGLKCTAADNCKWSDGTAPAYTNFLSAQPDVSQGDCYYMITAAMANKKNVWLNANCDRMTNYFVCQEKPVEPVCPPGYTVDDSSGKCFKVVADRHNFDTAEQFCVDDGGHLASVHTDDTNDFLYTLLLQNQISHAWIGLETDATKIATWSDGSNLEQTILDKYIATTPLGANKGFYYSAQPDMLPEKWFGVAVTFEESFVCEKGKSLPAPTVLTTHTPVPNGPNCGPANYVGQSGRILSPNSPFKFAFANCRYLISGSSNVVNLQIPPIYSAGKVWQVSVFDGSVADPALLIKSVTFGDDSKEYDVSSLGDTMLVTFYSDPTNIGQPFSMLWTSTATPLYPTRSLTTAPPATTQPTPWPATTCPPEFKFDTNRGICYAFGPQLSYQHSQSVCTDKGANLLSIHSDADQMNMLAILQREMSNENVRVWIGGSYGNTWNWIDGTQFDYTRGWIDSNSPQLGRCMAVEFHSATNGWIPSSCTEPLPSICYRKPTLN